MIIWMPQTLMLLQQVDQKSFAELMPTLQEVRKEEKELQYFRVKND